MKITRYKKVQRYLTFYKNHFQFRSPYQILMDATFCQFALKNKVNIREQMPKYLNDSVRLFTTVCVIKETEQLGPAVYGAMVIIKQFSVRKCGHERNPISANECLRSLIANNNSEHYLLATQDPKLSECARSTAGCPLIYMKMNTIVMEKPSDLSESFAHTNHEQQFDLSSSERNQLISLKQQNNLITDDSKQSKKRRKGPKGPNPLSCKKKKTKKSNDGVIKNVNKQTDNGLKSKRKRRTKTSHIKRLYDKIELRTQ